MFESEIQRLRRLLHEQLTLAERDLESLLSVLGGAAPVLPDPADQACQESTKNLTLIRYNRTRAQIEAILRAVEALEGENRGMCAVCGEPIGVRRLLALPTARHCVDCQAMLDESDERRRVA
ncbi:MAG: hypothetical protein EOM25_15095 [Deltaproteobacteria bacterium]|nr:hypothetical protein [Deltaproteobacteria bacterium]